MCTAVWKAFVNLHSFKCFKGRLTFPLVLTELMFTRFKPKPILNTLLYIQIIKPYSSHEAYWKECNICGYNSVLKAWNVCNQRQNNLNWIRIFFPRMSFFVFKLNKEKVYSAWLCSRAWGQTVNGYFHIRSPSQSTWNTHCLQHKGSGKYFLKH